MSRGQGPFRWWKRVMGIVLVIALSMSLMACGRKTADPSGVYDLYYLNKSQTGVEIHEYEMAAEETDEEIEEMLTALSEDPAKLAYKAPLAMGFEILDYELAGEILTLNVSAAYKELSTSQEVLVRAALVCSLTQIAGISYVNMTVEGSPLYDSLNNLVGNMSADQFVNNVGSEISAYDKATITLYFANEDGDGLVAVSRTKAYNTNISLERLVVEELIAGPGEEVAGEVYPTINPDTKVVSVRTKDGICYVNLDETFLTQIYNVTADVTIYSIVNSLIELSNVTKVKISVNGDDSDTYRDKYSFTTIFERNLNIITTLD